MRGWLSVKRSNFYETNPEKNVARDFGRCKDGEPVDGLVLRCKFSRFGNEVALENPEAFFLVGGGCAGG